MAATAERVPFRQTGASVALDAARGLAALLVLFNLHRHNLFFVNAGQALAVTAHPRLIYLFYGLTSAGAQAVVIFFVLSGYLISGSVFRSLEQGRWSWKDYLIHRLVRLWLVLLPALVLCAAWDLGRIAMLGGAGSLVERAYANGLTWKPFWGNLFFLEDGVVRTFGSDRVLWSLAAEFWYYMLFPLGLLALRRGTATRSRLLYGAGFLLTAAIAGRWILVLFPVWLCGTVLALARAPRLGPAVRWLAVALYTPVVFVLPTVAWPWRYFRMDYGLGMLTALPVGAALGSRACAGGEGDCACIAQPGGLLLFVVPGALPNAGDGCGDPDEGAILATDAETCGYWCRDSRGCRGVWLRRGGMYGVA